MSYAGHTYFPYQSQPCTRGQYMDVTGACHAYPSRIFLSHPHGGERSIGYGRAATNGGGAYSYNSCARPTHQDVASATFKECAQYGYRPPVAGSFA